MLAAYTRAARAEDPNILNDIKNAVSIANAGYKNTAIGIRLVLVATMSAGTYNETAGGDDFAKNLDDVDGSNGSVLNAVRKKRNSLQGGRRLVLAQDKQSVGFAALQTCYGSSERNQHQQLRFFGDELAVRKQSQLPSRDRSQHGTAP